MTQTPSANTPITAEEKEFSQQILAIALAARANVLMCVTESAATIEPGGTGTGRMRLVAASPSKETCRQLTGKGLDVLFLPLRVINPFKQAQYAVVEAIQKGKVSAGDRLVCALGNSLSGGGEFVLVIEVGCEPPALALHELVKLTDGIRPAVMEGAIEVACRIARVTGRGKRLGAIFMLGDSVNVLTGARQLVPNPFVNLEPQRRSLLNPSIHEMLVELAKLDGAFVTRGDGLIQTAGTYLVARPSSVQLPQGLGTRHLAAAAVTAVTHATAVVVSATDGNVRVYSHGELVLQMEPESFSQLQHPPPPKPSPG